MDLKISRTKSFVQKNESTKIQEIGNKGPSSRVEEAKEKTEAEAIVKFMTELKRHQNQIKVKELDSKVEEAGRKTEEELTKTIITKLN